jgi:hypothetical protein
MLQAHVDTTWADNKKNKAQAGERVGRQSLGVEYVVGAVGGVDILASAMLCTDHWEMSPSIHHIHKPVNGPASFADGTQSCNLAARSDS